MVFLGREAGCTVRSQCGGNMGTSPRCAHICAGGGRPAQNAGLMPTAGRRGMGVSRATSTLFGAPVGMGMAVADERHQTLRSVA